MSKLEIAVGLAKGVSTFVVASGAGTLIKTGVKMTLPIVATGKFAAYKKISVGLGAAALGGLTADATSKYLHRQIDETMMIVASGMEATANVIDGSSKKDEDSPQKKG